MCCVHVIAHTLRVMCLEQRNVRSISSVPRTYVQYVGIKEVMNVHQDTYVHTYIHIYVHCILYIRSTV